MKKFRLPVVVLLLCLLLAQSAPVALASDGAIGAEESVGGEDPVGGEISVGGGDPLGGVISKKANLSSAATAFTAINLAGWNRENLTLGGMEYQPYITGLGYALVRNGELTQAFLASGVVKELGDGISLNDFVIKDSKLADKGITPELLAELNSLIEQYYLIKIGRGRQVYLESFDSINNDDDIVSRVEDLLSYIHSDEGKALLDYLNTIPRAVDILAILEAGKYGVAQAEIVKAVNNQLGGLADGADTAEIVLSDGTHSATIGCTNLDKASDPYDERVLCTGCGCNPCRCVPPDGRPVMELEPPPVFD